MKMPPPQLLKKAQSGDAESQYMLASMYGAGDFLPQDNNEAAKWYRAAAERGHVEAQRNLGLMYLYGEGVPEDAIEGMHWIRIAAEAGSADAMRAMAIAYRDGLYGVEKDSEQAHLWSARADQAG